MGYITNGVFIATAIAEGFHVVCIGETPNAWFNISTTAWKRSSANEKDLMARYSPSADHACANP